MADDAHDAAAASPVLEERWLALARHRQMLEEYVRCLVRDGAEAEDVFQEVGLVVLQHPTGPDDPGRFAAWCRGVARNVVMQRWDRERRAERLGRELLAAIDEAYEEEDGDVELWTARRAALGGCLDELGAADRMLMRLRYVEEQTSEAIAQQMNRRADAIRARLRRVREVLTRCIDRRLEGARS